MQIAQRIERGLVRQNTDEIAKTGAVSAQEVERSQSGVARRIAWIGRGVVGYEHVIAPDSQPAAEAACFVLLSDGRCREVRRVYLLIVSVSGSVSVVWFLCW